MNVADQSELEEFLQQNPDIEMLELMMPDMNGILRCKRIQRREFDGFFSRNLKGPISTPFLGIMGTFYDEDASDIFAGDPDGMILPLSGTLARIPWLKSATAQVLTSFSELDGTPAWTDSRNVLASTLERFTSDGFRPTVATELEFYLIEMGEDGTPKPLLGKVPGSNRAQQGIQYCMADDLIDQDAFLDDVRKACDVQNVPLTAIHSEFSPGQWEINTHHTDDPLLACDHAMLLKRIVKGVARQHGMAASFMAKPFGDIAGSGLHIHASVYDIDGNNIFSDPNGAQPPAISNTLRHAIGGLAAAMAESMVIFAPNANSYRRFKPGAYAPVSPTWGYNHRDVALRIPVSSDDNRRVEHRVAGADANPYLTMAALLAGIHYGISNQCEPGPETLMSTVMESDEVTLPRRWDAALGLFREAKVLPEYLGEQYCNYFEKVRHGECDDYHAQVPSLDHDWYLRAL
ncbi:MAG: glutamine synthetase family protein [Halioglobus sp.]